MDEIDSRLGKLRRQRGLSAIQLAAAVGVKRQTIYAIEAGTYIPNTVVALRLARELGSTVEELFGLADTPHAPDLRSRQVSLLPGSVTPPAGQAVQLCQVDKRLMATLPSPVPWYLPPTDGVIAERSPRRDKTAVRIFKPEGDFSNRVLVAGCDPGISVLSRHVQLAGIELVLLHRNSSQSLALLKEGCIHIAGTHLKDESSGQSNLPEISRLFAKNAVAVISFAVWEEGILTPAGNPKSISGIDDFARKDICIVNRENGAGTRVLLDSAMKRLGMQANEVRGYQSFAPGHLAAAWQVQSGTADCCVATRAAAQAFGLHFIALASERYDFVIRRRHMELPRIQKLLDTLARLEFRLELEALGGYDTRVAGQRVL